MCRLPWMLRSPMIPTRPSANASRPSPKKLNALNLEMVRKLQSAFDAAEASQGCVALALRGAGERAFCAGGDIVAVRAAGLEAKPTTPFFREEYALNARIGALRESRVVQCSFWDGFTFGGGVGLSVHGKYRIATEKTQFAMPEVAIGLFPDVGASLALASCPGRAGEYAALTGARLDAADVVALKRRKTLQGRLVAWRLRAAREKLRGQEAEVRAARIYNRTMLVKLVRNWRVAVDAFKRDAAIAARVAAKRAEVKGWLAGGDLGASLDGSLSESLKFLT